ncbi:transposase [Mycolicibacterium phlei]|uniref:IS21 family transposase n=1 Tax=Mycolicibacterium phlei TaxID=1771 RepID=UPI0007780269|nr:IS21 family transposase [Mycolicibacterium phlei]VEG10452.1 transposase [Mycobacteroides chelonae]AMO62351.1 Integrase core domain protein [Mycolicibacterium phlei]KXW75127.1 transposase [Mycolicibacterium phlei DSM 43071]STZ16602.1 transposase [Mycolicibacterium phlei]STZ20563.1 transposase [Mycolicibacterium phlei]
MLSVEDWAEIRRLRRSEQLSISEVAQVMGVARNTVKAALASDRPPKYERESAGSVADEAEPRIRELLSAYPRMPSTVIAERIGWQYSIRTLSERVRELRPLYLPPDPASRTMYQAGEIAQCDLWFPDVEIPVGYGQVRTATALPVMTMVCGYSRWASALLIPTRTAEDLYAGWWQHVSILGAVPRVFVWDGESAVGRWRARMPELTTACQAFRGTLATKVVICKPGDPEAKGLVERFHDYLERAFLPGRVFTSPTDFNTQLGDWMVGANHRQHRVLRCRPADRIEADKAAMLPLPPVDPVTGWRTHARLPRDHYVRLDTNDYSVHPAAVGRRIEVVADLARVRVWCAGRLVAAHDRIWAKHQTISDPAHLAAAKAMRRNRFDVLTLPSQVEVEQRLLTDYDALAADLNGPVA